MREIADSIGKFLNLVVDAANKRQGWASDVGKVEVITEGTLEAQRSDWIATLMLIVEFAMGPEEYDWVGQRLCDVVYISMAALYLN